METENTALLHSEIYDSIEALDAYLSDIRLRREERRQAYRNVERLSLSVSRVREELEGAQQDNDAVIAAELASVLAEFERRLFVALALTSQAVVSSLHVRSVESPLEREAETAQEKIEQEKIEEETERHQDLPSDAIVIFSDAAISDAAISDVVFSPEEREAQRLVWLDEIDALTAQWNALDQEGLRHKDNFLNRPACFRMRSLACLLAQIHEHAQDMGLVAQISGAATELRDRMMTARAYANDTFESLPFDANAWTDEEARLSAAAWEELAFLYTAMAEAQEVWDWYYQHRAALGGSNQRSLVNAIGAAQQMLFRALEEYGGIDRLQGDLFGSLREAANQVGFLSALSGETSWEELEELARTQATLFNKAKQEVEGAREKQAKEARKTDAIQAVVQWKATTILSDLCDLSDLSETAVTEERARLLPLLDACTAASVPPTNLQVRTALLNTAPILLKDTPSHARFLEAVLTERRRRGMETISVLDAESVEEEDLPDTHVTQSIEYVRLAVDKQKILILGGSSRPQVAQRLKELLGCAEVEWVDSKKGDHMSKFKSTIARTGVIMVVKKFASHEMTEKGRDWAKEYGKMFVLLPCGYGVNQIVNQMYLQLVSTDSGKKTAVVTTPKKDMQFVSSLTLKA